MKTHKLKTWTEYFKKVRSKEKTFEIRKNDRDFKVGDTLILEEYVHLNDVGYTGETETRKISYVFEGGGSFGIERGYCVLGFAEENSGLQKLESKLYTLPITTPSSINYRTGYNNAINEVKNAIHEIKLGL